MTRRAVLAGFIAQAGVVLVVAGCGEETVPIKGGSAVPATSANVPARVKAAEKAEEAILKKGRKIN